MDGLRALLRQEERREPQQQAAQTAGAEQLLLLSPEALLDPPAMSRASPFNRPHMNRTHTSDALIELDLTDNAREAPSGYGDTGLDYDVLALRSALLTKTTPMKGNSCTQ